MAEHMEIQLRDINRVTLRVDNKMNWVTLQQGEPELLVIEAAAGVLDQIGVQVSDGHLAIRNAGTWTDRLRDALSTSLTRQQVTYHLTVRDLSRLDVLGMARVDMAQLQTEQLALRLEGACQLTIRSLETRELGVDLRGAGRVTLGGRAGRQRVAIDGLSVYEGERLESERASVQIRGSGRATVWATRELDVTIRGLGRVAYHGQPRVRQQVLPMGMVTALDRAPAAVPHF
jgi:hypothetical protein